MDPQEASDITACSDPDTKMEDEDPDCLDLSGQGLEKLTRAADDFVLNTTTLILDNNALQRLDNIHTYQCLEKLSVRQNRLVRMHQVSKLSHLKILNLAANDLVAMEGLKELKLLTWLSLADNRIKTIENLSQNVHLEHLDLSGNNIPHIPDLSHLKNLTVLLVHKNRLGTLRFCERYLPPTLTTLTLNDNQLMDMTDLSHLSGLTCLEQLTIANNPCIKQPEDESRQFDYRPFVINWCLGLRVLDGIMVGAKESLKAEWMYSQSKGRHFSVGQHTELLDYLVQTCPLHPDADWQEDKKLNIILSKVQEHQQSLRDPMTISTTTPSRSSTLPRGDSRMTQSMSGSLPSRRNSAGSSAERHRIGTGSASGTPTSIRRRISNVRRPSRTSPSPIRRSSSKPPPPELGSYNLALPRTLYGDDINGNDMMTQSMTPGMMEASKGEEMNGRGDIMTASLDPAMLMQAATEAAQQVPSNEAWGSSPVSQRRPNTLHNAEQNNKDQLFIQDLSDSEMSQSLLYSRLQSRLNPVPESLNSPDLVPATVPGRDDPLLYRTRDLNMSTRKDLPSKEAKVDRHNGYSSSSEADSSVVVKKNSTPPRTTATPPRATASPPRATASPPRATPPKTKEPKAQQRNANESRLSTPPSSRVDSGLSEMRSAGSRVPAIEQHTPKGHAYDSHTPKSHGYDSHTPKGSRSGSLSRSKAANKQVSDLKRFPNDGVSRKRQQEMQLSLADDESSGRDSESECEAVQARMSRSASMGGRSASTSMGGQRKGAVSAQNSPRGPVTSLPRRPVSAMTRSQSARLDGNRKKGGGYDPEKYSDREGSTPRSRPSSATPSRPTPSRATPTKLTRPRPAKTTTNGVSPSPQSNHSATMIQKHWKGHATRNKDEKVLELKDEIRTMRSEEHIKHLTKELQKAKQDLDQERKLRALQMDAIKVLWKEVQMMDASKGDRNADKPRPSGSNGSKISSRSSEHSIAKLMETLEATAGASKPKDGKTPTTPASVTTPGSDTTTIKELNRTCSTLQTQVEQLQGSLSGVLKFMSAFTDPSQFPPQRTRHSSSASQDTVSFSFYGQYPPWAQPTSLPPMTSEQMTMSCHQPSSSTDQSAVSMSRSCDCLTQTDISAVLTPKNEAMPATGGGFYLKRVDISMGESSDSEVSQLPAVQNDSSGSSTKTRSKSPRPKTLPGLNQPSKRNRTIPLKELARTALLNSPKAPAQVKAYAQTLVEGLITESLPGDSGGIPPSDSGRLHSNPAEADATDVSLSLGHTEVDEDEMRSPTPTGTIDSHSSHIETDSLEENSPKKVAGKIAGRTQ